MDSFLNDEALYAFLRQHFAMTYVTSMSKSVVVAYGLYRLKSPYSLGRGSAKLSLHTLPAFKVVPKCVVAQLRDGVRWPAFRRDRENEAATYQAV
ncbi:hypothetical protein D9M71_576300 [compost metagenome]